MPTSSANIHTRRYEYVIHISLLVFHTCIFSPPPSHFFLFSFHNFSFSDVYCLFISYSSIFSSFLTCIFSGLEYKLWVRCPKSKLERNFTMQVWFRWIICCSSLCGPGSNPGQSMCQGSGRPSKFGGFYPGFSSFLHHIDHIYNSNNNAYKFHKHSM